MNIPTPELYLRLERALSSNAHNDLLVAYQILFDNMNLAKEPKKPVWTHPRFLLLTVNQITGYAKATAIDFAGSPIISLRNEISSYENANSLLLRKTKILSPSSDASRVLAPLPENPETMQTEDEEPPLMVCWWRGYSFDPSGTKQALVSWVDVARQA